MEPMVYVNYCEKSEFMNPRCQKLSDLDSRTAEQDKAWYAERNPKTNEPTTTAQMFFTVYYAEKGDQMPGGDGKRWCILRKSMLAMGSLAFLCLLAFVFEMWTDITVFTDSTYITIGFLNINKKYMFDPILFIVFPLWTQMIFRGIREEYYSMKAVISGVMQLLMLSLISYLLFMKLPNIWLIELAAIEIITVIVAVRKYAWSCCNKKGNVLALIGLYIFFWGALLVVFYRTGMSFDQYSYGKDWRVYQNNIKQIITGASAFGCSSELISNSTVTAFLADRNNYFLAGLYYGGWVVRKNIMKM